MKLSNKSAIIFIYSARLYYRNYIYGSGSVGDIIQAAERENGSFLKGPHQGVRPRHKSESFSMNGTRSSQGRGAETKLC